MSQFITLHSPFCLLCFLNLFIFILFNIHSWRRLSAPLRRWKINPNKCNSTAAITFETNLRGWASMLIASSHCKCSSISVAIYKICASLLTMSHWPLEEVKVKFHFHWNAQFIWKSIQYFLFGGVSHSANVLDLQYMGKGQMQICHMKEHIVLPVWCQ